MKKSEYRPTRNQNQRHQWKRQDTLPTVWESVTCSAVKSAITSSSAVVAVGIDRDRTL
jgi:hypothetical protein